MFEKFTEQGIKVLNDAREEAEKRRHEYVDTPHMLLAVLEDKKVIQILKKMDLSAEEIRIELEKNLSSGIHIHKYGDIPFSQKAKKVLEYAIEEAKSFNKENYVSAEHILLGIIRGHNRAVEKIFRDNGIKLRRVRESVNSGKINVRRR